jgi:CRP/FNR family transcriptional regulator, cyclic AMP receptor protein
MLYSKTDLLRSMSANVWFGALPVAERKAMVASGDMQTLSAGDMLYRKGDKGGGFFGVVRGTLKVSCVAEDGREGVLSVMEAGNWFGETSLIDGLGRPHDVTAITYSQVLVISQSSFEALMERPAFAKAISLLLCSRVRALSGLTEDAMLRSTRTRIARRILGLARGDTSMAPQARNSVAVSQEGLAMMLGVTRQTLAKELKVLVRTNVLSLGYGRIDIVSMAELERVASSG